MDSILLVSIRKTFVYLSGYVVCYSALGNLANVLKAQGKLFEAEKAYKKALTHRSNMADVHYNL